MKNSLQIKSRKRVAERGEVFTNSREVNAMLDLVKEETSRIDSRFLEPACGTGNFLIEILRRKLKAVNPHQKDIQSAVAVSSIYGVDIMPDNIEESRQRMMQILCNWHPDAADDLRQTWRCILERNIQCGDFLKKCYPNGKPIIMSEWLFNGEMVTRRDHTLTSLTDGPLDLFSNRTFKAIHYLQLKI